MAHCDVLRHRARLARVSLHEGRGVLEGQAGSVEGEAAFLLAASGPPIAAFAHPHAEWLGLVSYETLKVEGWHDGQAFRMVCPSGHFNGPVRSRDRSEWNLLRPLNEPMSVEYGSPRPVRTVRVLLNNFDYEYGDAVRRHPTWKNPRVGRPLTVDAEGRRLTFRWRRDHAAVHALLGSDLVECSSLVDVSFAAWEGASEHELIAYAYDVATACVFVAGQLTNACAFELLDTHGVVVKRVIPTPVESPYRSTAVIPDEDIPRFFTECFAAHRAMRLDERWKKLSSYCGTVEACAVLEQRYMAVAIALEFVMRNALMDAGMTQNEVARLELGPLVGLARRLVGWAIPSHYEPNRRWRQIRNAVAHGNERGPNLTSTNTEFREEFDKLKLLLYRMALLKLGYQGNVLAPLDGRLRTSAVGDFSEERNTYRYRRSPSSEE